MRPRPGQYPPAPFHAVPLPFSAPLARDVRQILSHWPRRRSTSTKHQRGTKIADAAHSNRNRLPLTAQRALVRPARPRPVMPIALGLILKPDRKREPTDQAAGAGEHAERKT